MKSISINNLLFSFCIITLFISCSKDESPSVSAQNFETTISENPSVNQSIGFINAQIENANNSRYYFNDPSSGLAANLSLISATGELKIKNPDYFNYETNPSSMSRASVEVRNSSDELAMASYTVTVNLTDVDEFAVQERLNMGESPNDIYLTDNTLLDSLFGKTYNEGLIFYFDPSNGTGMVAAIQDQHASISWDPNPTNLIVTGATSLHFGDGSSNTSQIISAIGSGFYAAKICDELTVNGNTNWHLPSLNELKEMYSVLHAKGLGSFGNVKYWSSSELDKFSAWTRDFAVSSGQTSVSESKIISHSVRAVSSF